MAKWSEVDDDDAIFVIGEPPGGIHHKAGDAIGDFEAFFTAAGPAVDESDGAMKIIGSGHQIADRSIVIGECAVDVAVRF